MNENGSIAGIRTVSLLDNDPNQTVITKELIAIDNECFDGMADADEGDLDYWLANRSASFVELLLDGKQIIGYIDFLALSETGINNLEAGDWRDGMIDNSCLSDKKQSAMSLYALSMAIKKEYRGLGLSKRLWNSARERFMRENYRIKDVYGIVWTAAGRGFLKAFEPQIINHDFAGHPIIVIKTQDGKLSEITK